MTLEELAKEYEGQYWELKRQIKNKTKELSSCGSVRQPALRRHIRMLYEMARECKTAAATLSRYYRTSGRRLK